ncbi:MAG: NnrU family protein [Nevskia sp.]|nr:NnrU family protein [Nevskia sp.]
MTALIAASLAWLVLHIGIAGSGLRGALAGPLGDKGFRALFSLGSVAAIVFLVVSFNHAPRTLLWVAPDWLRWLLAALMLPAVFLLVASFSTVSLDPAEAGTRRGSARGILRVTRHPMMWSFTLWALVHILGNGELASTLFFGTFLLTALAGMPSIDAKVARRNPQAWQPFAAETSIIPGGAILAGRNRLVPAEIGWLVPLVSLALWAVMLLGHRHLFGMAPLPH